MKTAEPFFILATIAKWSCNRTPGAAMIRYAGQTRDLTIHCDGTLNITAGSAITINGKTIDLN